MKSLIFFFALLPFPNAFAQVPSQQLRSIAQKYVDAFEAQDLKQLKKVTTSNFISNTGGERGWRDRFKKLKAQNKSKGKRLLVKNLKVAESGGHTYVRFRAGDPMPGGQWFVFKKEGTRWYIDDLVNDFNPTEGAKELSGGE